MRKGFLVVLAVVLVAALAAPAMAGMDASGFVRVKGYVTNWYTGSTNPVLKAGRPYRGVRRGALPGEVLVRRGEREGRVVPRDRLLGLG